MFHWKQLLQLNQTWITNINDNEDKTLFKVLQNLFLLTLQGF